MMKIQYLAFFLLIFSSNLSIAQYSEGHMKLNNGTNLEGLFNIISDVKVKFKETEKSKPRKIFWSDIDFLKFSEVSEDCKYVYKKIKGRKKRPVHQEIEGKVSFFTVTTTSQGAVMNNPFPIQFTTTSSYQDWYIQKGKQEELHHIGSDRIDKKNFISIMSRLFKDCPELSSKIEKKELKKKDVRAIINYYNNDCNRL